jgi:NADPH:quinone reductase-like Zn-dependent oxidoreductase
VIEVDVEPDLLDVKCSGAVHVRNWHRHQFEVHIHDGAFRSSTMGKPSNPGRPSTGTSATAQLMEPPARMRAAYVTELGPADAIRVGELAVPAIGPTDVLVRVEVVVVNPVDTLVRSGAYPTPTPFPFVVGRDLVGTVAVAGPGAAGFAPGDRVWCNSLGHGGRQGSFAEFAVVPAERLYRLPDAVDPVAAVAAAHPAATAYLALFRHGRLRPGESVYVGGAAGNVGTALTSLARNGGARVLAGARSEDAGWCRSAGAAEVVDYRAADLAGQLRGLAPGGVDLYVDTSGHLDLPAAVDLLADRGRIVLLAGGGQRLTLPAGPLYTHDRRILGFVISRAGTGELGEAAAVLNGRFAAGDLPVRVRDVWPLERAAEAHRAVERGVRGRIVLRVAPAVATTRGRRAGAGR